MAWILAGLRRRVGRRLGRWRHRVVVAGVPPAVPPAVSCAAAALYRAGGLYATAAEADLLMATPAAGAVELIGEVFPPFQALRPAPAVFSCAEPARDAVLRANLHHGEDKAVGAASGLVRLRRALIHGNVLYDASGARRRVIYETYREVDRPYVPWLGEPLPRRVTDLTVPGRETMFLGSAGSFNYGHWLVDDLPRLAALPLLRTTAPVRLLMVAGGGPMDQVRQDSVEALCGVGAEVVWLRPDRVYRCDGLSYATPVSCHPMLKSPHALEWLANRVAAPAAGRTRLYLARGVSSGRSLLNEAALWPLLAARGFVRVEAAALSFADQAGLCAGTAMVAGVMGAAMTNTLFAPPATVVGHLAPEGWLEPFYWDLAAMRGHAYFACYGPAMAAEAPHLADFTIAPAALSAMLDAMESAAVRPRALQG
ncbi:glycosyltransferase family 61 protein [Plastoroseomonas arctica]|uniref:Glycosyltransferase family 61 protein n=1 Tax=Plastoroseomonas arctica TaxID=1509237 RepID=A0AAF1JUI4_9PROT|nr:glycosyltransferase family 61 protein [Plastoroseomonas arctica]